MSSTETEPETTEPEVPFEEPETPDVPEEDNDPDQTEGVDAEAETPAPEPAPEGMSIEELEKVRGQLDRSATTWRNRVSQLLGEEAQFLVPCELCDPMIPGFHWPAEMVTPTSDVQARLLEVVQAPSAPDYREDPFTNECTTCGGWGKTKTRSHVAGKTERVCPSCKGLGFRATDGPQPAPATNGQVEDVQYNLPDDQPLIVDDKDSWGSPKLLPDGQENPNWGRMPQYKNPTLP